MDAEPACASIGLICRNRKEEGVAIVEDEAVEVVEWWEVG